MVLCAGHVCHPRLPFTAGKQPNLALLPYISSKNDNSVLQQIPPCARVWTWQQCALFLQIGSECLPSFEMSHVILIEWLWMSAIFEAKWMFDVHPVQWWSGLRLPLYQKSLSGLLWVQGWHTYDRKKITFSNLGGKTEGFGRLLRGMSETCKRDMWANAFSYSAR